MKTFSDIVDALNELELCDHCLGRQVGKLSTGTSNDERGRALRLFSKMSVDHRKILKSAGEKSVSGEDDSKDTVDEEEERVDSGMDPFNGENLADVKTDTAGNSLQNNDADDNPEQNKDGDDNPEQNKDAEDNPDQNKDGEGIPVNQELSGSGLANDDMKSVAEDPNDRDHHEGNGQCSLCGGLFTETDNFTDLVVEAFSDFEFDTFLIGCVIDDDVIKAESDIQFELGISGCAEGFKSEMNRVIGLKVFDRIGKEVSFGKPDIVGVVDTRFDSVSVQLSPIFMYGRYQKFDRTIPQTIWNCKRCRGKGCEYCEWTGKIYPTSVQELIGDVILRETGGSRHLFHGMGREDIDARMLGTGRPFILEISNPKKRDPDLHRLTEMVNSNAPERVKITELSRTVRQNVSVIKNMKSEKSYLAEVEFEDEISEEQLRDIEKTFTGTVISQRTPTRVAHRRSDLIRERKVININCRLLDGRHTAFTIKGESGLYIKELIHGNEGRTQPSVSEYLKTGCKVLSLDVLEVHYDDNLIQG